MPTYFFINLHQVKAFLILSISKPIYCRLNIFLLLFIIGISCNLKLLAQKDVDDIKKEANKAFENEDYVQSYKMYSQLVANFSKEPLYNYRLGVSMIYAESDKKKCIPYLEFATKFVQKKETPTEALYYLGKAYHVNYRFDDAIKYYKQYKQEASASKVKEMEVDKEIIACENGKKLLSNIKELIILSKKKLNENEYFRSYDLSTIGGKLLVKPDDFKTKYDKKKKDNSIIYLPQQGDKVFFSSYGEDGKNGKDIYYAIRLPNGSFAKPQSLSAVNTPYDEDFPFLHPNGKVLYFASKGHKGMGGYDIFKSEYNEETQTWSTPENLEFPINSPGDDFLFVTDSSQKIAFFSTSRYTPPHQIHVLKIKTERVPPLFVAIKGKVRKTDINQSIHSVITVKDIETGNLVGTFTANDNGEYYMELPNGGKFLFTVETPGFTKQSESVNLPISYAIKPLGQMISYEKNVLTITNYFDEVNKENAYLDIVEFIEKKAQLEVNEEHFKQQQNTSLSTVNTNTTNTQNDTQLTNENNNQNEVSAANTPIPPSDTKELLSIVKKDIESTQKEINQLEIEDNQLKQVIQLKNQEIKTIDENIQDTQKQINISDSPEEKEQLTKLLDELQDKKISTEEQKQFFEQYQKEVENNLNDKKRELETNQQFVNALEELDKGKNKKATIDKLQQLQKELQLIEKQKTEKSEVLTSLNNQEKEKQAELTKYEKQKINIENDIQLLQENINNLENELANTKDKTQKESLQYDINERENELKDKQNTLNAISLKLNDIKDDIQSIQEQKTLLTKIKNNESISTTQISSVNKTDQKPVNNPIIDYTNINQINKEYQNKISTAKTDQEKIIALEQYNQLLLESIKENKKKISTYTNSSEKQKLQNLNSELEQIVKSNDKQLSALKSNAVAINTQKNNNQSLNNNQPLNNNQSQINNQQQNNNQYLNNNQQQNENQQQNNNQQLDNQTISQNNQTLLPINIPNQQEVLEEVSNNEKFKSDFIALKNQFDAQTYKAPSSNDIKKNAPTLSFNKNPLTQAILDIINANNQSTYLSKQADSIRKLSNDLKSKAAKTNNNNQKQKLLADAKKYDVMALEKEYQAARFSKTMNQNTFIIYDSTYQTLSDDKKQKVITEYNNAKQAFKQAEQIRKEASTQSNLTIKIAAEQNAQEKEQIALSNLTKIFKDNNISLQTDNIIQSVQIENKQIQQQHTTLQKQYITANNDEINYLMNIADTSQKIKTNTDYLQSLNQLKEINKNIQTNTSPESISNSNSNQLNDIINNQLQLIQQLRQITSITQPAIVQSNNYIPIQNLNSNASKSIPPDTAIAIAQKIPLNINTNSTQQLQTLIQEQKQLIDNIKTENPVYVSQDEILKTNEALNTQVAQLTNNALALKQQMTQVNDYRKKSELQIQFERTNAEIQEKKVIQTANEILINQAEYIAQNDLLNQLINSIPSNNESEKNIAQNAMNEIKVLKKQEESLIKETLALPKQSAQLGALQNVRIKQLEYIQKQQELIDKLSKYAPNLKKQNPSVNLNDPLLLSLKYQSNTQKQIKEWEAINTSLNLEITRLYPKYSNTPAGKILTDAQKLIAEAKNTDDQNKKLQLYIQAAQLQQKAMQQLSATTPSVAVNNNQQQPTTQPIANKPKEQTQQQTNTQPIANAPKRQKSIKVSKTPLYSEANPIPLNPALPNGLIFSVQVGAFKNPLPNNFFNGLSPIFAQNTENNLYRYLVGQMSDPQEAIALRNNFRNLGYNDAFVIAYYNGKRISFSEALEILKKEKQKDITINPYATTNVLQKANIPTYPTLVTTTQQKSETPTIRDAEEINDLYFTIQVGVYGKNTSDATFKYIKPIIRNSINDRFFRYSAGIYDNLSQAQKDLVKVINLGMKDAFICAYWNGKRIFYPEAEKLIRNNKNIRYATPQPIQFPNELAVSNFGQNLTAKNAIIETTENSPPFDPTLVFTNNITKRPEPTPENGVKPDNTGICYRVQIGAFRNRVPKQTAAKYFKIKDWPIEVHYINGLYIYTVGNFIGAKYAAKLRNQMVELGISDAFITVYKDNKKLFGYEALKYLNQ